MQCVRKEIYKTILTKRMKWQDAKSEILRFIIFSIVGVF